MHKVASLLVTCGALFISGEQCHACGTALAVVGTTNLVVTSAVPVAPAPVVVAPVAAPALPTAPVAATPIVAAHVVVAPVIVEHACLSPTVAVRSVRVRATARPLVRRVERTVVRQRVFRW
ncbi:MAG: hypothetical protein R3C10_03720 [Pirellulales bacterium]